MGHRWEESGQIGGEDDGTMTEAEIEGMLFEDGGRGCEVGSTSDL